MKAFFSFIAPVGLALTLLGCATEPVPDVSQTYDPNSGFRTDLLNNNELAGPMPLREIVCLDASRFARDSSKYSYFLEVHYMAMADGAGYINIPPGETLGLEIDGQKIFYRGSGSQNLRKADRKGVVRETAIYEVKREDIRRIASAKEVRVSIKGTKGLIERKFTKDNFDRFQQFVAALGKS